MAFSELEERISKIRQQNEEIKRRYEEVEEDKKNAAKSNALVQMVPSTVWPERKEPPEYSNPPKTNHKQKSATKEQSEHVQQHHPNDRRKGEGPPPDPKYNFLADAEREEYSTPNNQRDNTGNKNHSRSTRGNFKKRGMGKEGQQQKGRTYHGTHRDEHKPEYEAWRKERNRIDEDRISRQKTAEGNWRREWDNDKAHLVNEISKGDGKATLGDYSKKDGRYSDGSGYVSHNRGGYHKSHRGSPRNYHNNYDYSHMNAYDMPNLDTSSTSVSLDERTVVATDKSIKVTLNQSNLTKGPVLSVKVNSPSIAGTGRVGPRQRTRVTYSSHSDIDTNIYENGPFSRQKSFEDKTKGNHYNNVQRTVSLRRPQSQKKKENGAKSPFTQRKEFRKETSFANSSKHYENGSQSNFVRKEYKDSQKFHYPPKSPRTLHKNIKILKNDSADVTNDNNTIKDEKNEVVSNDNDVSIESDKIDIESPNEMKDDECIVENESKSDIEEKNNEIILQNSECSPSEEEMITENIESNEDDVNVISETIQDGINVVSETNQDDDDVNVVSETIQDDINVVSETIQDDINVVSETNQDDDDDVNVVSETNQDCDDVNVVSEIVQHNLNISEDKFEETIKDNIVVQLEMQDTQDENIVNDENKEIDNLTTIINNTTEDSCNTDNNTTSILQCISELEDKKTDELIQDNVSKMTNDEISKESSDRDDSDQNNDQNDIVAMNSSDKVSEIMIETCSEETLHPPIDKSVMALEENNEVPIEKSELLVNNINDQTTIENIEDSSSICMNKVSSNSADIGQDKDVKSEEIIVEKTELQCQTKFESVVVENRTESDVVVTQANSEN